MSRGTCHGIAALYLTHGAFPPVLASTEAVIEAVADYPGPRVSSPSPGTPPLSREPGAPYRRATGPSRPDRADPSRRRRAACACGNGLLRAARAHFDETDVLRPPPSWVENLGRTIRGTNEAIHLIGTVVDITERKRNEEALARSERSFRAMADQSPVIMWVSDATGGSEFVNRAYCEFFGVTPEQIAVDGLHSLVRPDDHLYITVFEDAVRHQAPFAAEARFRRADGEWRSLESRGEPRYDDAGHFAGILGVSIEVTDQRLAAKTLREAAQQKDEFIALLAHELRNPLAPYQVRMVCDGESAVREAEAFAPGVVLQDLGMPGVTGQAACCRIRGEPWGVGMMVVALSGWGQDEDRRRTRIAGFDDHLVKPVDPDHLVQLVRDLTRGRAS